MDEGMGGPWRGGRTDFWVPRDLGSAHPASPALYCVPIPTCTDCRTSPHLSSTAVSSTVPYLPPTTVEKFRCIAAVETPTKNIVPNPAHIRHTNALGTQQG